MTRFEISDDELSTEILHDEIERLRAVLDKTASDLSDEIARSLKAEAGLAEAHRRSDQWEVRAVKAESDRTGLHAEVLRLHAALAVMTQRYKSTQAERDCEYEDRKAAEAELADLERALDGDEYVQRMRKAEAAIARVREVCMQDSWDIKLAGVGFVSVRLVLRALDGAE